MSSANGKNNKVFRDIPGLGQSNNPGNSANWNKFNQNRKKEDTNPFARFQKKGRSTK